LRTTPGLTDRTGIRVEFDARAGWMVVDRGALQVIVNLGQSRCEVVLPEGSRLHLASSDEVALRQRKLELPPVSVAIAGAAIA
jgi:hypothetical protein